MQLYYYKGKKFLTDEPNSNKKDAVFPICFENKFFASRLRVKSQDKVLDLCTGSGILAIFAAKKAKKVVAVDLNPRALELAKINAQINKVASKINFSKGDLFKPIKKGEKFDVIVINPPFEPVPPGFSTYLHSNGGKEGTKVLKKFLKRVKFYLSKNGSFQFISWIPESELKIVETLKSKFPKHRFKIHQFYSLSPSKMFVYLRKRLFKNNKKLKTFKIKNWLKEKYLFLFVECFPRPL